MRLDQNPWPILNPNEMRLIHQKTVELLESPGLFIEHDGFLDALESKGATVDRASHVARIPARTTEQATLSISGSPSLVHDNQDTVESGISNATATKLAEPFLFRFGGSGLEVLNRDRRTSRTAMFTDLERVVRFGNGHPRISSVGGPPVQYAYEPDGTEVPSALRPIAGMVYAAKHCKKLSWNEIASAADAQFGARLGTLLAGSDEEYRKNPTFLCVKCSISPLKIDRDTAAILYELAKNNLPIGIAPMPLAGGTSPVTPASAILVTNAEILGMMTAIWALGSESAQEHLPLSAVMDMQTTIASFANPNAILQDVGVAQMWSAFYGVPVQATTDYIDAKFPGFQSGMERAFKIATALGAGSIYPSVGQLKSGLVCSCTQACLDIEAFDWMHHFLRGVEVTEDSLAVDLFREQGIGGHFLGTDHTVRKFKEEFYLPSLSDRNAAEVVQMVDSARAEVEGVLSNTPVFSRDEVLCREIDAMYKEEIESRG